MTVPLCSATAACNPHVAFMPFVEAMSAAHHLLGGSKAALGVLQFGFWAVVFAVMAWVLRIYIQPRAAFWIAGATSYLLTGLVLVAWTFYAITPAMNWVGVVYMTILWLPYVWFHLGIPDWFAPLMFTF